MTNAYDKNYLHHAQKNFGHMIDFAVNTCNYNIDEYFDMFLASNICIQYEVGNPAYIVGKTGCELARMVIFEIKNSIIDEKDVLNFDKSPEYWLGWALSYYVWFRNYKFKYVLCAISASEILRMHNNAQKMNISKFVSLLDKIIVEYYTQTPLTRMRNVYGISQSELAERSGVNLRVIQSYEQRLRDINKAQLLIVARLAQALDCHPTDLIDK